MITWMQKHKKWLIVTIWVSVIAFIAAGMIGWGQYDYSLEKDSVAKVGKISISKNQFTQAYQNAFNQKYESSNGQFDEVQAKAIKLDEEVLNGLISNALIRNYALDLGIRVTNQEIAENIQSIDFFKNEEKKFDEQKYKNFLQSRGIKISNFEEDIKNDLLAKKIIELFILKPHITSLETKTISSIFNIEDSIELEIINGNSISIPYDEQKIKNFWENVKTNYKTPIIYTAQVVITKTNEQTTNENELYAYYNKYQTQYLNEKGELEAFDNVKQKVISDLKHKKAKDEALIDYSKLKKGQNEKAKEVFISENSGEYSHEILTALKSAPIQTTIKPIPLENDFISIKVIDRKEPQIKNFEEIKNVVTQEYIRKERENQLNQIAQKKLPTFKGNQIEKIQMDTHHITGLDSYTSQILIQEIFTSTKSPNYAIIGGNAFLFRVIKQTILPFEKKEYLDNIIYQTKNGILTKLIFDYLEKRYEIKKYI